MSFPTSHSFTAGSPLIFSLAEDTEGLFSMIWLDPGFERTTRFRRPRDQTAWVQEFIYAVIQRGAADLQTEDHSSGSRIGDPPR